MALGMWRYSCDHPTAFNAGRSGRPHHHLARLSPVRLRTQPIADDALPARDIALHKSAPAIPCMVEGTRPGLTLPEAALAGDHCNKAPWIRKGYVRPGHGPVGVVRRDHARAFGGARFLV